MKKEGTGGREGENVKQTSEGGDLFVGSGDARRGLVLKGNDEEGTHRVPKMHTKRIISWSKNQNAEPS